MILLLIMLYNSMTTQWNGVGMSVLFFLVPTDYSLSREFVKVYKNLQYI